MGKPFPKYFLICSRHFQTGDLFCAIKRENFNKKVWLKKGAFPTQNWPKSTIDKSQKSLERGRSDRLKNRQNCISVNVATGLDDDCYCSIPDLEEQINETSQISIGVQCEVEMLLKEIQANLENTVFVSSLWDTDSKFITKTGIPIMSILKAMVEACGIINNQDRCTSAMSLRNRILLTMHRLKSNCSFVEISIDFQIFSDTIQVLSKCMKCLIHWQTREENIKSLPSHFNQFPNVMTVLDCTETKTITFGCLKCRISTYSHYKGAHTLKVLIGVAPSGLINFISPVVAGRTSGKAIFNLTNLISQLKSGEAVMVDKGFMIGNELSNAGIEMIRPDILYYSQSKCEVKRNTQIASARVNVERQIARLKVFKILSDTVALSILPYIDDIMTVICAISNLDTPILKDDKFI